MKKTLILLAITLFISACSANQQEEITSFQECIDAGNPMLKSYPAKCIYNNQTFVQELSKEQKCEGFRGNWIENQSECEYISEEVCQSMNGSFSECASACRNNPNAQVCTLQCVPVCSFS